MDICHRLVCRVGQNCRYEEPGAEDGSPCEQGVCLRGKCVPSSQLTFYKKESHNADCTSGQSLIRSVPSNCINKDINIPIKFGTFSKTFKSCQEIIEVFPNLCFGSFLTNCCKFCHEKALISENNQIENEFSICAENLCKNGGLCRLYGEDDYVCECKNGFIGKNCNEQFVAVTAVPTTISAATTTTTLTFTEALSLFDLNYIFNLKRNGQIIARVNCSQGAIGYGVSFCKNFRKYCLYSCRNV